MMLESQGKQGDKIVTEHVQALGFEDVCRDTLSDLVKQSLSEQERLLIVLYYSEQLTVAEIGQVLDLSEARVTQIHTAVLSRLWAQIGWQGDSKAGRNG